MKTIIAVIVLFITGCVSSGSYDIEQESPSSVIITGEFDRHVLQTDDVCKIWYERHYEEYQIDPEMTTMIGSLQENIRYVIVAGTWCGDSKRQLPRLFKIFDAARISNDHVKMLGVDRSKKSDRGDVDRYAVRYVPTIIVFRNDQEIGRIVERPVVSLESDLLSILQQQ